ncbi:hypothetical protein, partial [uncultured Xanthomonas sp.]|uniref:hypothetical protein n=1 Tax=uncultured Xanthomonas sp. TaxID=152831 RepID=UPI0025DD7B74
MKLQISGAMLGLNQAEYRHCSSRTGGRYENPSIGGLSTISDCLQSFTGLAQMRPDAAARTNSIEAQSASSVLQDNTFGAALSQRPINQGIACAPHGRPGNKN